jgi:hypothetical protein
MTSLRRSLSLAATVCAVAVAGCGGGGMHRTAAPAATPAGPPRFLSATDLERDLGNGFRSGLYRLAVMSQPRDEATDLGQDLPTGTVQRVRCAPAGARPAGATAWAWRCSVRWRSVAGRAHQLRYAVRNRPDGCFSAGATPALPAHRDATIESFSEHPLNTLVSVRKGC